MTNAGKNQTDTNMSLLSSRNPVVVFWVTADIVIWNLATYINIWWARIQSSKKPAIEAVRQVISDAVKYQV